MVWHQDDVPKPLEKSMETVWAAENAPPRALAKAAVASWEAVLAKGIDPKTMNNYDINLSYVRVSKAYLELEAQMNKIKPTLQMSLDTIELLKRFTVEVEKLREKHNL